MDPLTLGLLGGLGLLALALRGSGPVATPKPTQNQSQGTSSSSAPPSSGVAGLAAGAAIAGAAGGVFGKWYADNFTGPGVGTGPSASQQVAVPVGAAVGAGSFVALGGVSGATAIVGGAVLPAVALLVVPAVVVVAIVLSYVQIFDTQAKTKRWTELYKQVHALIAQGAYAAAWKIAEDAATKENLPGLGFHTGAKSAIPATLALSNGASINVAETLKQAYAISQKTGDEYANAINAALPWMCTIYKSGDTVVLKPNGAVIRHFSPYFAAAEAAVAERMANDAAYQQMLAQLDYDAMIESSEFGEKNRDQDPNP